MASLLWDDKVGVAAKVRLWEGKGEGVEGEDLEGVGLYKETNIYIYMAVSILCPGEQVCLGGAPGHFFFN